MNIKRYLQNFGELVREFRRSAGLSQEALAMHLDIHRNSVTSIEAGLVDTSMMLAGKILDLMKASSINISYSDSFLSYSGNSNPFVRIDDYRLYRLLTTSIKTTREQAGLSRETLARIIGLHRNTIERFERADTVLRHGSLILLYEALGIDAVARFCRPGLKGWEKGFVFYSSNNIKKFELERCVHAQPDFANRFEQKNV